MPNTAPPGQHSPAWITFTYASFTLSVLMIATGILFAPVDIWIKPTSQ
jgi:hypothetical protein